MTTSIKQTKISTAVHYAHNHVDVEPFFLSDLAYKDLLANGTSLTEFQQITGLADFYWQVIYYQPPYHKRTLSQALAEADGYIFFMHGWDGSHRIWEELPLMLAAKDKSIVCFNLDVNGFGNSPFIAETPSPEHCSPAALMAAVEYWLTTLNLWPHPPRQKKPYYLFVGHSMSGAAFFYMNRAKWRNKQYGCYALAPALFCNDVQRRAFFKAMGLVGIRLPTSLKTIKNTLAPHVIDLLGAGASPAVKNEHLRVYNQTAFGTIAQVIYTMGKFTPKPQQTDWSRFRIALGHRDRIVNLANMLDLLTELDFRSDQIQVMLGDHYFFSFGEGSPQCHQQNQNILFENMRSFCRELSGAIQI